MKYLLIAVMIALHSCATSKDGCNQIKGPLKLDKKKFRVERTYQKNGLWYAKIKKENTMQPTYDKLGPYECLPDSIYVGKEIYL